MAQAGYILCYPGQCTLSIALQYRDHIFYVHVSMNFFYAFKHAYLLTKKGKPHAWLLMDC